MKRKAVFFLLLPVLLIGLTCSCQQDSETDDPPAESTEPEVFEVEIFGHIVWSDTTKITFSGDEITGISELSEKLKLLNKLERVNLGNFHMFEEEMRALSDEFHGVTFEYIPYVSVAGVTVPSDVESLNLEGRSDYDLELLKQELSVLRKLKSVTFGDDPIPADSLAQLQTEFSQVEFTAIVTYTVAGKEFRADITELDLSGEPVPEEFVDSLNLFPLLESINLHGTGMQREQLLDLKTAYPEFILKADVEFAGEMFSTEAEELDLNSKIISDYDQFRETIVLFDSLAKVEMCDCGLSNEQMAALRDAYPNTKFVWRIYLGQLWALRTDAVAFSVLITHLNYTRMTSEDIEVLKYCTDLQALDLGHQAISDLSVIGEYLTQLRILILADNKISDLSPLANLPHLHYLEVFVNQIRDITPLAQCRELVDLNLCTNYYLTDITPLLDLPLLERIWLVAVGVSRADINRLQEAHPNATISIFGEGSTENGWRTHPRYYAMIDMFYQKNYISEEFSKYDNMA